MADTYTTIRDVIEPYLATNWTYTAIQWPNAPFTPPEDAAWIQPAILPGRAWASSMGTGGANRVPGLLHVNVFVPRDQGTETAWDLVDKIRALFNRKTVGNILFGVPYSTPPMTDDQWIQFPVLCPFDAFETV